MFEGNRSMSGRGGETANNLGPAAPARLLLLCDECELSKNGGEYEGQSDCLRGRRGQSA